MYEPDRLAASSTMSLSSKLAGISLGRLGRRGPSPPPRQAADSGPARPRGHRLLQLLYNTAALQPMVVVEADILAIAATAEI